jgi:hypothetical protein
MPWDCIFIADWLLVPLSDLVTNQPWVRFILPLFWFFANRRVVIGLDSSVTRHAVPDSTLRLDACYKIVIRIRIRDFRDYNRHLPILHTHQLNPPLTFARLRTFHYQTPDFLADKESKLKVMFTCYWVTFCHYAATSGSQLQYLISTSNAILFTS